ncbi:anthocyanidin 5,3-O-glucosyltransferase-like [Triticum dicoccoides]|uniref:anthocyanidin 5,3-O-glucosyltransferase-like n=1 Tax=Triticum dicoccoides TaxID=85692 RepID=UPI000E79E362|nr:anthocyanidin 5,3-O-glucosyltransferase-like [Triticum dicoccoides]
MSVSMTQKTVVLYPSLGVGHLNPMVELANVFLRLGQAVVIAVVNPPDKDAVSEDAMARLSTANPAITFRLLPVPSCGKEHYSHPVLRTIDVLRAANPSLREFLRTLPAVDALVVDMFCVDALDVAAELDIPAYFFFASAVGDLAIMLHLPYYYPAAPCSFKDMGKTVLRFPGVPPIRAVDMSTTMLDRESDIAKERLRHYTRMPRARGFLTNSFDWLEARALEALRYGLCTPGRPTPPVYCIGPLVLPGQTGGSAGGRHACLEWLDAQPERGVVFLCFGSLGTFSAAQLAEVARGLQDSGHRFLWVVRSPPEQKDESVEPDLQASLPEGFLEKTAGRGFVVKNWAPQAEVLRHGAVGAFVTHCGWNSVLEGIVSGVPMICWPLYAEQRMNKVHVVEEMKVGVAVEGYEEGLVKAEEVAAKVRLVMASEEGSKLREKLVAAKEMAAAAVKDGGSSDVAFHEFLMDLEKCRSEKSGEKSM